jgi:hypothetical protein
MSSSQQTVQEIITDLPAAEVLARAKSFFAQRPSLYATFLDKEGPTFCSFRGQGGEEVIVAAMPSPDGRTQVTGSTYLFDMQLARFLTTLPPAGRP